MPDPRIRVSHLVFYWPDGAPVLDDLSFALGPARTGLVAPNGAGKSTLLKLLAGELQAQGGQLDIDGVVGYLPQDLPLDREATVAEALGIGVTAWSPLASGLLTGKYAKGKNEEKRLDKAPSFQKISERNLNIATAVVDIAKEIGKSPAQVALNWLRAKPGVIPILGARKAEQFEDNMGCLGWTLSPQHLARLDEASRIELGFPTDFLHRKEVRENLHGGAFDRIQK